MIERGIARPASSLGLVEGLNGRHILRGREETFDIHYFILVATVIISSLEPRGKAKYKCFNKWSQSCREMAKSIQK